MGNVVPPVQSKNSLQTGDVEPFEDLDVMPVDNPRFAAIEQCRDADGVVDRHLGLDHEILVEEDPLRESPKGAEAR